MSTANFLSKSGYYYILDDTEMDEFDVDIALEDMEELINENAKEKGYVTDKGMDDNNWSYFGKGITCVGTDWKLINGVWEYRLEARIVVRSGYYAHANLDFEIFLITEHDDISLTDDDELDIWQLVFDDVSWEYGKGFATIVANKAEAPIESDYERLESFIKEELKSICDFQLGLDGSFSNGEAVYSVIE